MNDTAIETANQAVAHKFALGDYDVKRMYPLKSELQALPNLPPDRHEEHSWGRPKYTLLIRAEILDDVPFKAELVASPGYLEAARHWVKLIKASVPELEVVVTESK